MIRPSLLSSDRYSYAHWLHRYDGRDRDDPCHYTRCAPPKAPLLEIDHGFGKAKQRYQSNETEQHHDWRNALAARALISISAIVPPVTQLPPTQSTGLNASHSGALASVIPPVGQKLHW